MNPTSEYLQSARTGDLDRIKELLEGPAKLISNIEVADAEGKNALLLAAEHNRRKVFKYMLQQQIDINCKDNHGRTALHYACKAGDRNFVLYLLLLGADWGMPDNNRNAPGTGDAEMLSFIGDVSSSMSEPDYRRVCLLWQTRP